MSLTATALMPFPEPVILNSRIVEQIKRLWDVEKKFQILSGPPGTGKTSAAQEFISYAHANSKPNGNVESYRLSRLFPQFKSHTYSTSEISKILKDRNVQFIWDLVVLHPQYTYEDLIRGYRAAVNESGQVNLVVGEGILGFGARVCEVLENLLNLDNKDPCGIIILDEINRAPIGQLFGEALYALDRRGTAVTTPYEVAGYGLTLTLPKSLLLLGTMNSIDRSASGFDFALKRRFANIHVSASREAVENAWNKTSTSIGLKLYDLVVATIETAEQCGTIPKSELQLGQAYFIPPAHLLDNNDLNAWLFTAYWYQILPTLRDYREQGLLEFNETEIARLPLINEHGLDSILLDPAQQIPSFITALI